MKNKRAHSYKAFAVAKDGTQVPISAQAIVVELGPKHKLFINLEANSKGGLTIETGQYRFPEIAERSSFSSLIVRPHAANVITILVEPVKVRATAKLGRKR